MPNKSTSEKTIEILLKILNLIPNGTQCNENAHSSGITARQILQKLNDDGVALNIRTVQRHLLLLCEHYQITIDTIGNTAYYSWRLNAPRFDIPRLTVYQSLLLALTQKHLNQLLPSNVQKSMEAFFQSAQTQLQENEKQ